MPTDTERREVARRLRELDDSELQVYDMTYFAIQRAVGCEGDQCPDGRELCDRLADLIEPPARCPHYMHPCCRTDAGGDYIDRDALLTLANEMDERSRWVCVGDAAHAKACARRIREALGVE